MNAKEIDRYLEQVEEKARQEGRTEGRKEDVLAAYEARFGSPPDALVDAVERETDEAALRGWLVRVATASAEEVAAALPRPTTTKRRSKTTGRRAAASR